VVVSNSGKASPNPGTYGRISTNEVLAIKGVGMAQGGKSPRLSLVARMGVWSLGKR